MTPWEIRDLYRESSYEEAAAISRDIAAERDAIDPIIAYAEALCPGWERSQLYKRALERFQCTFMGAVEMTRAAKEEADRILREEGSARVEAFTAETDELVRAIGGVEE
jgi:hypothetical protein